MVYPASNHAILELHQAKERIEKLEEALRTELTHGGVNDEIAQVSTSLGAIASVYKDNTLEALGQKLDEAREDSRDRLETALGES